MLRDDAIRMLHMLDAAREAISFSRGRTRNDLDSDKMLTFALVRAIEIVGEAASKITAQTRAEFPEMPWRDIVGMRNRIIHAYFDIDLDRVWDTVKMDLPVLVTILEQAIGKPQD